MDESKLRRTHLNNTSLCSLLTVCPGGQSILIQGANSQEGYSNRSVHVRMCYMHDAPQVAYEACVMTLHSTCNAPYSSASGLCARSGVVYCSA